MAPLVALLVAFLSLLVPIFSLREGFDVVEAPVFSIVAIVLWARVLLLRRSKARQAGLQMLILAVPLLVNSLLAVALDAGWMRARMAERSVRITSFEERPIYWPNIDEPVGLHIEMRVEHALPSYVRLYPPTIRLGDADTPEIKHSSGDGLCVSGEFPEAEPAPPSPVSLRYDLYPPTVLLASEPDRICFKTSVAGRNVPRRNGGSDLEASWVAYGGFGNAKFDLSRILTAELRSRSALQDRPDEWWGLMQRLTPERLEQAKYRACSFWHQRKLLQECYCSP